MRRLAWLGIFLLLPSCLFGQNVVVDWVGRVLVSSPAKINQKTQAQVQVTNVNDVLYKYSVQITATPRVDDDFSAIASAFTATKGAGESAALSCPPDTVKAVDTATTDLGNAVATFYQLPENQSDKCSKTAPCSININDTRAAWKKNVQPKVDAANQALTNIQNIPICQNKFSTDIKALQAALKDVDDKAAYLNSNNHVITMEVTLEPDTDYAVDIKELYLSSGSSAGTQTTAPTLSVKFSPATDQLTLSAGALLSEIQNRAYTSQAAPTSTGTTQNVLTVSGISKFSLLATALLNYQIPSFWKIPFGNDDIGLAVSSGPVLRLGSQSNASSFGFFVGGGLHLYHRFYISPGVHIGQFADFPSGFSKPGQPVPSGLSTPTAVNRTTVRFAFAITYRVKDFSALGLKTSTSTNPSPTSPKKTQTSNATQ